MNRRDVMKGLGSATVLAGVTVPAAAAGTDTGEKPPELGGYARDKTKPNSDLPELRDVAAMPDNYFTPNRFNGKTVIVTGCARGMGLGACQRLAREGARVVGVDWLEEQGRAAMDALASEGHEVRFVAGDVADDAVCAQMVKVAVEAFGGVDAALNNAGVMDGVYSGDEIDYPAQKDLIFAPIHEASETYWDKVFRTNIKGVFLSMRHELRQMIAQGRGGSILNVGSIAGMTGLSGNPAYVASKHAVNGLTKNAALDYAPYAIRVNSVNMAATDTPMVTRAGQLVGMKGKLDGPNPGMGRAKLSSILAYADSTKRSATVAEQVSMMCYLLSPEAGNMTGAIYATDGGWTAY